VTVDPPRPDRGLWTIPNLISIIRLACLPIFVFLLFGADNRAAAAWLLAALGMSDWCDGYIARHFNQVSEIGKILDPVADRLLFFVGLGAILADGSIPVAIGVAILAREVVVGGTTVILGLMGARRIDVTWFGKAGTFANMMAVPSFLGSHSTLSYARELGWLAWITVVPGLVLSYIAAALYVPIARRALAEGRAARFEELPESVGSNP
jgi:cardiolipin synthase